MGDFSRFQEKNWKLCVRSGPLSKINGKGKKGNDEGGVTTDPAREGK